MVPLCWLQILPHHELLVQDLLNFCAKSMNVSPSWLELRVGHELVNHKDHIQRHVMIGGAWTIPRNEGPIQVKLMNDGTEETFRLFHQSTLLQLRSCIKNQFKLGEQCFVLKHGDRVLSYADNHKTIFDLGLLTDPILTCKYEPLSQPTILVTAEKRTVGVPRDATVKILQQLLAEKGVHGKLYWNRQHLQPNKKLRDYTKDRNSIEAQCYDKVRFSLEDLVSNHRHTIECEVTQTIQAVVDLLPPNTRITINSHRFVFAGKEVKSSDTLLRVGIQNGSVIHTFATHRGGGAGAVLFTDVTKLNLLTKQWDESAPKWRGCAPGFCVEGVCKNWFCKAYNEYVVCSLGFNHFDMELDAERFKCPMCTKKFKAETCGFNNCVWKFYATKIGSKRVVESKWSSVSHRYETFDEEASGQRLFDKLVFHVSLGVNLKALRECPICTDCCKGDYVTSCNHWFHKHCLKMWAQASTGTDQLSCPLCRTATRID